MVEHGATVAVFLGIVDEGSDVLLLTVVGDPGADGHGDVTYRGRETPVYSTHSDTINGHGDTSPA